MYIEVYSGLASRIQTIADAYSVIKQNDEKRLVLIWPLEAACHVDFWDIFDETIFSDIDFKVISYDKGNTLWGGVCYKSIKRTMKDRKFIEVFKILICRMWYEWFCLKYKAIKILKLKMKLKNNYFCTDPTETIGMFDANDSESEKLQQAWDNSIREVINHSLKYRRKEELYIEAYRGFLKNSNRDFTTIRFRKEFCETARQLINVSAPVIGVHIRRTDHVMSIKTNLTVNFYKKMDEILESDNTVYFFLATDSLEEEKKAIAKYGEKILFQRNKIWNRTTAEGMKSSVIELLALAGCQYILGSKGSAYSEFAALFGKIELHYC